MDLRRASAGRCFNRIRGRRGEDVLRRLSAGLHELRPPLPARGGPGPAHRPTQAGRPGRGTGAAHRGRGARLLLSPATRLTVAGLALAAALLPQTAFAHAQLLQSGPPPDAILAELPPAAELVFTEPVSPAGAGIKVFSPSGHQVAGPVTSRGRVLSAPISSAEIGTFVLSWQVLAADTHPSRGAFRFSVGHPSANPYSSFVAGEFGTATPLGFVLQALSRWVHFVGFALAFGVTGYRALMRRQAVSRPLVRAGVILLIAAEPLALLGQLASLSFDGDTALAVLASSFGRIAGLRLGGALLVWSLLGTSRFWPVLAIGGVVAVLDGAAAHAIPGLPGVGQTLVAIHVAAMGLWVGGLVAFLGAPDRVFGRYAAITLAIAVASGFVLGLAHTNFGTALLTTDYGRVLMIKVVVVGGALAAAALRRHRTEFALGMAAVACATLVAALPPPN